MGNQEFNLTPHINNEVMKKIIVPTDFSRLSHHALDFAVQLARPLKAHITLLHLEEVPLGDFSLHLSGEASGSTLTGDALYNAQLFRANSRKMGALLEEFSDGEVTIEGRQYGGGFMKGIQHYIEKNGGDLVVIGTTGEESIQEFFSGNHTEQLIEHLHVPVISLQDQQFHKIEDVVLGLDIEDEKYTKRVLESVKDIVEPLNATLHIVDITTTKNDETLLERLNKTAKIAGLTNFLVDVIEDNKSSQALLEYAVGTDAGLIVLLSEAKGGINRFINPSFAAKLTKASSIPILTIRNN